MKNKVAIITGGLGGLGTAICQELSKQCEIIIACDLDHQADRISKWNDHFDNNERFQFEPLNVNHFDDCKTTLEKIVSQHKQIDILVNAAGITRDKSLKNMDPEQWQAVIDTNLSGVFNTCKNVLPYMLQQQYGRIINISSVNGQTGQFGQTNYSAAKAGMHGFTMALARETASKGITVNSISPGYCETELIMTIPENIRNTIIEDIPMKRLGKPEEIAKTVAFLANPETAYITGANIPVNGGYFMS